MRIKISSLQAVAIWCAGIFVGVICLSSIFEPLLFQTLQDHGVLKKPEVWLWLVIIDFFYFVQSKWFYAVCGLAVGFAIGSSLEAFFRRRETDKLSAFPPIGSFRYINGMMLVSFKKSTTEVAAQIEIELINDTDKVIRFEASTTGNINAIAFASDRVVFSGIVGPHGTTKLVSARVVGISYKIPKTLQECMLRGTYEYEISYGFLGESLSRKTSKGCIFELWHIEEKGPGTRQEIPITVQLYNELEC